MTTPELLAIIFISACFLLAFSYIILEEKVEADIFKSWDK